MAAKRPSPVCFIAMAFDRPDTDRLYVKGILPVPRRNRVTPVIINRRQSNTDLNIQIIAELRRSDFCIADLTYSRPSVYFEAGYAERLVPVVYTVRKDHLRPGQPEDLRVHFDLQMKPLIPWKGPADSSFPLRLERRLRATVLRDWNRYADAVAGAVSERHEYARLSLTERLAVARRRCMSALRSRGFRSWRAPRRPYRSYDPAYVARGYVDDIYSIRSTATGLHLSTIHAFDSATKTELSKILEFFSPFNLMWRQRDLELDQARRLVLHHFVLALKPTTSTRIESVFNTLVPLDRPFLYASPVQSIAPSRFDDKPKVPFSQHWHFVSPIHSEKELAVHLKSVVQSHVGKPAA